jgi:hypothetical protein
MMGFTNDWDTACIFSFCSGSASLAYKDKDKVWNGWRDCKLIMIPIHVAMQRLVFL